MGRVSLSLAAEMSGVTTTHGEDRLVGVLCRILRDGVDVHRCLAARALGRIGDRGAVDGLLEALLDEDEDVRGDAAGALARLADPRAAGPLMENLLGDPSVEVKLKAIEALTGFGHADLVPWLRRMVKGRDADIAWDDNELYQSGWDDSVDVQTKAIEALAAMAVEAAVPDIVSAIDDEFGQDLTEAGFKALARLGEPGAEALAGYLSDGDERRRRRAAAALAGAGSSAVREVAARALGDPSPAVRLAVAEALAARDPSDPHLAILFRDPRPDVRRRVVRLCGSRHPDGLATLLDDEVGAVRLAVLEVVAEAPDLVPTEAVLARARADLGSSAPELAGAAARALAALDPSAMSDHLVALLGDAERPVAARLGALQGLAAVADGPAARALIAVLGDDARQLRLEALAALAAMARASEDWPNACGEALLAALEGELVPAPEAPEAEQEIETPAGQTQQLDHRAVDAGAVDADADDAFPTSTLAAILGREGARGVASGGAAESVGLSDEDMDFLALVRRQPRKRRLPVTPPLAPHQDVRRFAARVLGDIARDEVARALAAALGDGDGEVRLAAADSLARVAERIEVLPAEAVEALVEAQGGAERDLRLFAVRALGAARARGAAGALAARLGDDDSFVRGEAIRALSKLGAPRREIAGLLGDPDSGVCLAAARALAEGGGEAAVERLVEFAFAFEGRHRREAARLLRGVDPEAASARFLEVLEDPGRTRSWQVAIEALEELNSTAANSHAGSGTTPAPGDQGG